MQQLESAREFQLAAFVIGHSEALLVGIEDQTRIELLFKGVAAMKLRRRYPGLAVRMADADESAAIQAGSGTSHLNDRRVWVLESDGVADYVVAGSAWVHEGPGRWGEVPVLARGNVRWPWADGFERDAERHRRVMRVSRTWRPRRPRP